MSIDLEKLNLVRHVHVGKQRNPASKASRAVEMYNGGMTRREIAYALRTTIGAISNMIHRRRVRDPGSVVTRWKRKQ